MTIHRAPLRTLFTLVSCCLLTEPAFAQALPRARPEDVGLSTAALDRITTTLQSYVDSRKYPGFLAVIARHGKLAYIASVGWMDVEHRRAMSPDAVFRIYSLTKPIASTAVMQLYERGKLRLDDPVSKYVPGFEGRPVLARFNTADGTYDTRPAKRPVTIRHLMTHTSGLGYGFSSPIVSRLAQGNREKEAGLPLLHDPGDKWTYGTSTRVLGQVVEKISGQPLDVFFRDRIFGPLKMTDTSFVVPPEKVSRVVTVHQRVDGKLVEQPNAPVQQSPVNGEGGLYSTARDYGVFLQMLLNGGSLHTVKLLGAKSVAMMGANQIGSVVVDEQPAADPARTRPFPLGAGRDKFGLGFQIAVRDERYAKLRNPGSLSWAGINNTHFWIDPERQVAAAVLMQLLPFYDEACLAVLRGFERRLYEQLR